MRIIKNVYVFISKVSLSSYCQVTMTITELEKPSLSELLSAIGGSVGLWLGIGAFQAFEICSNLFYAMVEKARII